jgi:hypothetical protein
MPANSILVLALSIILTPGLGLNTTDQSDEVGNQTVAQPDDNATDSQPFVNATELAGISALVLINEIELNPEGNDTGDEWIELFNPGEAEADLGGLAINGSKSISIELQEDFVIDGRETLVVHLANATLSNVGETVTLVNSSSGEVIDSTPSLVDRKDNGYTWQRMPDGDDEWEFLEETEGRLNDPSTETSNSNAGDRTRQDGECLGTAGCVEGIAIRIVDGDTLYVSADASVYKVDLALVETAGRDEDDFLETTMFTRSLCLGSPVLVDQDDNQLATDGSVIASVYCSSVGLAEELLDNDLATLDAGQCGSSEFASSEWAREHGC